MIERIREKIRSRDYYLSSHSEEEMAEDAFERADMENAILSGFVEKKSTRDPRGTRPCMKESEDMKCEFCNADTVIRSVKKQHWFRSRLYIVENVRAEVCAECGERYFHATTLDAIEQMIAGDHPVKEVLSVEVLTV